MSAAAKGERRQIAVVFSDLSGFTAMTEQLDPEDVRGVDADPNGEPRTVPFATRQRTMAVWNCMLALQGESPRNY